MRANHKEGCYVCDSYRNLEVHHIIPRKLGGCLKRNNTVLLCKKCHEAIEHGNKSNIHKVMSECSARAIENCNRPLKS